MAINDEIREQQQKLKGKGFKYKFAYFWEYYRWHTLAAILIIFTAYSLIKNFVTAKDTAFQAVFINSTDVFEAEEFTERIGIDTKKFEAIIDGSYYLNLAPDSYDENTYVTGQKVMALVTASSLDVIVGGQDVAEYYGRGEMLIDLRTLFGNDFVESMGDKILWIDTEPSDENDPSLHIPVGINISDAKKITDYGCYPFYDCFFTVVANTSCPDYVLDFYDYLYE